MKKDFKSSIKKMWNNGIFGFIFIIIFLIYGIVVVSITFVDTETKIEQRVINGFCKYIVENDLISIDNYVDENVERDDYRIYYKEIYTDEDLCLDIYFKYVRYIINYEE